MSRLFCRSREDVQSSWKAALTSIELRCQLIFCPASQSSQFPGLFFPPKKSFSFWREIFFAAHDCIFVESSSTMSIDNNNNKKKNFGSKSFARVNSDLFSLISFCPPPLLLLQSVKLWCRQHRTFSVSLESRLERFDSFDRNRNWNWLDYRIQRTRVYSKETKIFPKL